MSNFPASSSFGYQPKFYDPQSNCFVKSDSRGGEAVSEVLVSEFLEACGYPKSYRLRDERTCESLNFLRQGESFLTFKDIFDRSRAKFTGVRSFKNISKYISNELRSILGVSFDGYLIRTLTLDVMFRNTDRHLRNLGVITDGIGFRPAPMFDNGCALGVSEGVYWDIDNLVSGNGFKIKPYELSIATLEEYIKPELFDFDVMGFVSVHDPRINVSHKQFGAFLSLLCKYYPYDRSRRDTKQVLESVYGNFRRNRYRV